MQATSFVVLTGHLDDYPLADLIAILRRQRKSGRLLIEYALSPCSLYFVEGDLVDAQLNKMGGLQAVVVALSQPNASFNFNPLIQPPRRSINESSQRVVFELLGCWEEKTIDAETQTGNGGAFPSDGSTFTATPIEVDPEPLPQAREVLALPASSVERANRRRQRQVFIASAIISLLVSLLTVVALTRWLIKRDISAALSEIVRSEATGGKKAGSARGNAQTIKVVVRVEKGRVAQAFVEAHSDSLEAYEATALRIARARRYAPTASGEDTVLLKINAPE
ncbi:MAG TPA: DUF4388 domain-containing protein [Pyrinomonadaceae bacterium]